VLEAFPNLFGPQAREPIEYPEQELGEHGLDSGWREGRLPRGTGIE
jgi:hypothetical protein